MAEKIPLAKNSRYGMPKAMDKAQKLYQTGTVLWVVGFGLVLLSWTYFVPPIIGWSGCGLSLIGAGLQYFARRQV
jgi:predicted benzoate:H+ symporter BenE